MTSNQKQQRLKKEAELRDNRRRFYHRNIDAMRWCNKQGFTIYAAAQSRNTQMVKVFKQKGEKFLPLSDRLYDQENPYDVIAYIAAIDVEYERMYNLKKENNEGTDDVNGTTEELSDGKT